MRQDKASRALSPEKNQENPPKSTSTYTCECGKPAKFFQLESGKHVCEQCTLNEIYAEESYQDVQSKVMQKMRNIMAVRQKHMMQRQLNQQTKQALKEQE